MTYEDKVNYEYSLKPIGMDSSIFWELAAIVGGSWQREVKPTGLFPLGTDLEEVRQAMRDGDYDKVRRLTGALR